VSDLVIDFVAEIESGFNQYYWKGSFVDQPVWFMKMLRIAQNELSNLRKEKAKK